MYRSGRLVVRVSVLVKTNLATVVMALTIKINTIASIDSAACISRG